MGDSNMCGAGCGASIMWWTTLLVAVLAVPSIAIIITSVLNVGDLASVLVFIVTCWICTYLGMRLMQNPKIKDSMDSKSSD